MIDVTQILVSLVLFAGVFLLVWALFRYPTPTDVPVHRRVAAALGAEQRQTIFEIQPIAPVASLALALASRMSVGSLRDMIRRNLDASGNPGNYSVDEFLAMCLLCGGGTMVATGIVTGLFLGYADIMTMVLMFPVGFAAPLWSLRQQAAARTQRISKQLPYTLDLVALMMTAGSTFSEAIDAIIRDDPEDDLNQELRIVQAEIDLGTSRANALSNMSQRIPLDTLRSVVGAVNQSESLGTPLSTILISQSSMMRMHRSVRSEKLSASAGLRILIPMMLILIAAVLILFSPLIIRWQQGMLH